MVSDTTLNKTYLYFSKNIPTDMLPLRGDLISSHNVPMIDFALCDQVDAVEMEGNNYKVTSHVVALDKIFKVLEGDFILDISSLLLRYPISGTSKVSPAVWV